MVVFKTKVLHFRIEKTMEREGSKECSVSFLWTNESFSLWNCHSRNSTLFSSRWSAWLVLNHPRQRSFGRNVRYILYSMVNESTFLKGKFCIYKGFMDVLYILTIGVKEKPQNVSSVEFCHVLSRFNLRERIHDPASVTRIAFKD